MLLELAVAKVLVVEKGLAVVLDAEKVMKDFGG